MRFRYDGLEDGKMGEWILCSSSKKELLFEPEALTLSLRAREKNIYSIGSSSQRNGGGFHRFP